MSIRLTDLNVHWTGTDPTTPKGHVLAVGTDPAGHLRVALYAGSTPNDDVFCGSLLVPPDGHGQQHLPTRTTAYGPGGAFVTSAGDQTEMLAQLANRATEK